MAWFLVVGFQSLHSCCFGLRFPTLGAVAALVRVVLSLDVLQGVPVLLRLDLRQLLQVGLSSVHLLPFCLDALKLAPQEQDDDPTGGDHGEEEDNQVVRRGDVSPTVSGVPR